MLEQSSDFTFIRDLQNAGAGYSSLLPFLFARFDEVPQPLPVRLGVDVSSGSEYDLDAGESVVATDAVYAVEAAAERYAMLWPNTSDVADYLLRSYLSHMLPLGSSSGSSPAAANLAWITGIASDVLYRFASDAEQGNNPDYLLTSGRYTYYDEGLLQEFSDSWEPLVSVACKFSGGYDTGVLGGSSSGGFCPVSAADRLAAIYEELDNRLSSEDDRFGPADGTATHVSKLLTMKLHDRFVSHSIRRFYTVRDFLGKEPDDENGTYGWKPVEGFDAPPRQVLARHVVRLYQDLEKLHTVCPYVMASGMKLNYTPDEEYVHREANYLSESDDSPLYSDIRGSSCGAPKWRQVGVIPGSVSRSQYAGRSRTSATSRWPGDIYSVISTAMDRVANIWQGTTALDGPYPSYGQTLPASVESSLAIREITRGTAIVETENEGQCTGDHLIFNPNRLVSRSDDAMKFTGIEPGGRMEMDLSGFPEYAGKVEQAVLLAFAIVSDYSWKGEYRSFVWKDLRSSAPSGSRDDESDFTGTHKVAVMFRALRAQIEDDGSRLVFAVPGVPASGGTGGVEVDCSSGLAPVDHGGDWLGPVITRKSTGKVSAAQVIGFANLVLKVKPKSALEGD